MIDAIAEALKPYNEIIGVGGIVLGVLVSVYFYFIAKREKRPTYVWDSIPLVDGIPGLPARLEVISNNKRLDLLTAVRLYFWNAGRDTIRRADLTEAAPLTIKLEPGANILDARIDQESDPACRGALAAPVAEADNATNRLLTFDYLDYGDGFVIQILHDGSRTHRISVTGKIIGAESIKMLGSISRRGYRGNDLHTHIASTRYHAYALFVMCVFAVIVAIEQLVKMPGSSIFWFLAAFCGGIGAMALYIATTQPSVPRRLARLGGSLPY